LQSVILIAVGLNILTAFFAWAVYGNIDKTNPSIVQPVAIKADQGIETINRSLSRNLLLFIGFALGYLSLSQELIWYRILGFISANNPEMLAMILTAFLVGIALAAIKTNQLLSTHINTNKYILSSLLLMIFVWYFTFPLMAWAADESGKKASALLIGLIMTGVTAYITGGIFPILCHMLQQGTQNNAGSTVSKIYFANVMGATLGPLFTGFVLFEYFLFQTSVLIIGLLTAAMIVFLLYTNAALSKLYKKAIFTLTCLSTLIGLTLHFTAYNGFLEKLQESKKPFNSFNYNRSGYISVIDTSIFGNGAYDGKMSIDPLNDKSGIRRAYAIPAMHPNPKRILQIGLSGGSWAKALSMYQPLEQLVSVEINKGYLDIIGQYPDHADILHNQKIKLVIDDGRRWLKNNPDEKFDFIISNTIYHWRSNATNMLSIEFMNIAKRHLNPGGLVFIIDTDADEVSYTAAHVFSYVSRNFGNMVIAGDSEAVVSTEQKMSNLAKFITPDGQQLFQTPESAHIIADMTYPNQREAILNMKNLLVITDDNMATEFKMHKKPH
jgi:spermidine synthase